MQRKKLMKKGISLGLACLLTISMAMPTIAEEQTVPQATEVQEEVREEPQESEETNDTDLTEPEKKENPEENSEILTDDAEENEKVENEEKVENSQDDAKQEEQLEIEEDAVSVRAAREANSFKMEGTVLKEYTGTGGAVTIPDGVTEIADNAFYGEGGVTSVRIPSSVKKIGYSAFSGCYGIVTLTI